MIYQLKTNSGSILCRSGELWTDTLDTAFAFPYDTFITGIFNRVVDAGTFQFVIVDATGKLGTIALDAAGKKVGTPQAMLNESRNQQKRIAELEASVERQQKGMEVLTAQLKEQATQN